MLLFVDDIDLHAFSINFPASSTGFARSVTKLIGDISAIKFIFPVKEASEISNCSLNCTGYNIGFISISGNSGIDGFANLISFKANVNGPILSNISSRLIPNCAEKFPCLATTHIAISDGVPSVGGGIKGGGGKKTFATTFCPPKGTILSNTAPISGILGKFGGFGIFASSSKNRGSTALGPSSDANIGCLMSSQTGANAFSYVSNILS